MAQPSQTDGEKNALYIIEESGGTLSHPDAGNPLENVSRGKTSDSYKWAKSDQLSLRTPPDMISQNHKHYF